MTPLDLAAAPHHVSVGVTRSEPRGTSVIDADGDEASAADVRASRVTTEQVASR